MKNKYQYLKCKNQYLRRCADQFLVHIIFKETDCMKETVE